MNYTERIILLKYLSKNLVRYKNNYVGISMNNAAKSFDILIIIV